MENYFDAIIVTPLEEEFLVARDILGFVKDLSSETNIRFEIRLGAEGHRGLLIQPSAMGKTAAALAMVAALTDYRAGLVICLGIAGGLSNDVNIGDVCFSGGIIDVYDNSKITNLDEKSIDLALSPSSFETPKKITVALNLGKVDPEISHYYEKWQEDRFSDSSKRISGQFTGKGGVVEKIVKPTARSGMIVCGAVSGSSLYNKKLHGVDRRVLAIETESGGLFAFVQQFNVPVLTIRGISDYAGADKNQFERETGGAARHIAAMNAVTFLAAQLANPRLLGIFNQARESHKNGGAQLSFEQFLPQDQLGAVLSRLNDEFEAKLRDLSPDFTLNSKGYRLPIPRIRILDTRAALNETLSDPLEIREAIRDSRVIVLTLPKDYPDYSLSWLLASDLLTAQLDNRQLVPVVIEGGDLRRPRVGLKALTASEAYSLQERSSCRLAFVIDNFKFSSRTQTDFLEQEIRKHNECLFVIVTRDQTNIILEANFSARISGAVAYVCDVPFFEIAYFLQKNFAMTAPESQVVANRLRNTFRNFNLSAHPTFFAGIPRNTLAALLQANRRAELIQLAVAGYLSYVVASDNTSVVLSRTTREQFLSDLAFQIHVEKKQFDEAKIVAFTKAFAERYDYALSPIEFVNSFKEKGILHFDNGRIRFTLPFMESYLLAKKLSENEEAALKYFDIRADNFDTPTFAVFAEIGPSARFVSNLTKALDDAIAALSEGKLERSILLGDALAPAMVLQQERLQAIQKRVQSAAADVRSGRDETREKQRLLDATDRIRENVAKHSATSPSDAKSESTDFDKLAAALPIWKVGITLLGSGAERLEAETKRGLITQLVKLSSHIVEDWTRAYTSIDFSNVKKEMIEDAQLVKLIAKSDSGTDISDAKRTLSSIVDVLEFILLSQPLLRVAGTLCEEARDKVLAESLFRTPIEGGVEQILHSTWLADVDTSKGKSALLKAIKSLPKAKFLRVSLATHLINRVFWNHWNKEDRIALLDVADEALRGVNYNYKKSELKRMVENQKPPDELKFKPCCSPARWWLSSVIARSAP